MSDKEAPLDEPEPALVDAATNFIMEHHAKDSRENARKLIMAFYRGVAWQRAASTSLPLPGMQWSETAAIHAAHAAGFAGESWFMGPEELAHLLTLAHPAGQQEQAVLSDLDRGLLEQVLDALDGCVDTLEMASDFYSDGPTVKKATAAIAAIRLRLPSIPGEQKP